MFNETCILNPRDFGTEPFFRVFWAQHWGVTQVFLALRLYLKAYKTNNVSDANTQFAKSAINVKVTRSESGNLQTQVARISAKAPLTRTWLVFLRLLTVKELKVAFKKLGRSPTDFKHPLIHNIMMNKDEPTDIERRYILFLSLEKTSSKVWVLQWTDFQSCQLTLVCLLSQRQSTSPRCRLYCCCIGCDGKLQSIFSTMFAACKFSQ